MHRQGYISSLIDKRMEKLRNGSENLGPLGVRIEGDERGGGGIAHISGSEAVGFSRRRSAAARGRNSNGSACSLTGCRVGDQSSCQVVKVRGRRATVSK